METYHLTINTATGAVLLPSKLQLMLDTQLKLSLTFRRDGKPTDLPAGTTGRFTLKADKDYSGDPLLLDAEWTVVGSGAAARYLFETPVDSALLRSWLGNIDTRQALAQVQWQLPAEARPRKSAHFPVTVHNSITRPEDTAPDPAADAVWDWIKARLQAHTNVALTYDEGAKKILIASTASAEAESIAWAGVTGKPSTFPPSTHTHPYTALTGSPSDNTALAEYITAAAGSGEPFDLIFGPVEASPSGTSEDIELLVGYLPQPAVIHKIQIIFCHARPRPTELGWAVGGNIFLTHLSPDLYTGNQYAQSFSDALTFVSDYEVIRIVSIPSVTNNNPVTTNQPTKIQVSANAGAAISDERPTWKSIQVRIKGRYTA